MLIVAAGPASAQSPNDTYWIQLHGFRPTIESTARFDSLGAGIKGTEVNFEDELGLSDRESLPNLLMGLRLGERWRLEFEYFELKRKGTRTIQRDIHWGDAVFPASGEVSSQFDSDIYRLSAGYSVFRSSTVEVGGALGLHVTDFVLALGGKASGPQGQAVQSEQKDQRVPLPTLGLYGTWALSAQWTLSGRVDYLSLEYEQYDGSLRNLIATVSWRFSRNFGAGLGYRYVAYEVNAMKSDFRGNVSYKFRGPTIYLEAVL